MRLGVSTMRLCCACAQVLTAKARVSELEAVCLKQMGQENNAGIFDELNEANDHAGCIAAPIVDASGRCIAAISVVVPEQRLTKPDRDRLITSVTAAAERLSRRLC